MSSEQPQQTDGPKVTFRESWPWHAAEEAGTPKLSTVPLFKFFGMTTTSDSELDALQTPEPGRETGKKETGQKRSVTVAETHPISPLNPKRQKQEDHGNETTARELFASESEGPKECVGITSLQEVTAGPNTKESSEDSEEDSESDSDAKMMRELFGSDAEDEVTEVKKVQVPVGSDDPLIWPRELFGTDPLIVEATEPQPGDPEIYGGEMVLDEPPPSRSNDEVGGPNREDVVPKKYGCSKCRWSGRGCSQCLRWADANSHGYVHDPPRDPQTTASPVRPSRLSAFGPA